MYTLLVAKSGLKVKPAIPIRAAAGDPDAPPGILGFYGRVQTRTTTNADGSGETTTISNLHMGTVLETDGPDRIQRWDAPNISFEGLAELLS